MSIFENWDVWLTLASTLLGSLIATIDVICGSMVHKTIYGDWNSATFKSGILTHAVHIGLPVFIMLILNVMAFEEPDLATLWNLFLPFVVTAYIGIVIGDFNSLRGNLHLLGDDSLTKIDLNTLEQEVNHKMNKLEE